MADNLAQIVHHLVARPTETEWIEFKINNEDPEKIGETISALANSATVLDEQCAYMVWGVRDGDHEIVGTNFDYRRRKIGNHELEGWLHQHIRPHLDFRFQDGFVDNQKVVLLLIPAAVASAVRFKGTEFIRIGSAVKKLADFGDRQRALWKKLGSIAFEAGLCRLHLSKEEVIGLLDIDTYYRRFNRRRPLSNQRVIADLKNDALIAENVGGELAITNLGGILFAFDLPQIGLGRKVPRVVWYRGDSRVEAIGESPNNRGYAVLWEFLLDTISQHVATEERIGRDGIRRKRSVYPEIAIRELVANALIHQDFTVTGSSPMVEIFETRIEISNPGGSLIDADRFIDSHPKSRNEALGQMMRLMGFCEERGTGVDKAVTAIEERGLPPLDIRIGADETKVTMFAHRPWKDMSATQRVEAAFQHAALQAVKYDYLTNASLRARFALPNDKVSAISRVIALAVEAGRIKSADGPKGRAGSRYVPYYAA